VETRRKSEMIESPCGQFRQRVFKGQRWMVIAQRDENDKPMVCCFNTREQAEQNSGIAYRLGYMVHYVVEGKAVSP
jgi:hypothetical protein